MWLAHSRNQDLKHYPILKQPQVGILETSFKFFLRARNVLTFSLQNCICNVCLRIGLFPEGAGTLCSELGVASRNHWLDRANGLYWMYLGE